MKSLTVKMRDFIDEGWEKDVNEVFQVYQGNGSVIIVELCDTDFNFYLAEINQGYVKLREYSEEEAQEQFLEFVKSCQ